MRKKKFWGVVLAVTMMFTGNAGISTVIQGAEFSDGSDVEESTESDLENVDTEENSNVFEDSNNNGEGAVFESGEIDLTDEIDNKIIEDEDIVTEPALSSYPADFRYWSQGQSDDMNMRDAGCWIVAQAKLLYETGVDRSDSFNPDNYFIWQRENGLIYEKIKQTKGEKAPVEYAKQKGKELIYLEDKATNEAQFWDNINKGYYTIIKVPNHYVYLDNEKSKETGQLYCDDSSSDNYYTGPRLLSEHKEYIKSYVYEHVHSWDVGVITKNATCKAMGIKTFTCSCGATYTENIPLTNHNWSDWKVVKETKEGQEKQRKCKVCGKTEKKTEKIQFTVKVTSPVFYNGKAQKPKIKVYKGTKQISSWYYSVTYKNNINVGKATVNVKGKRNYSNCEGAATFEIKNNSLNKSELSLELKKSYQLKINNAIKKGNWTSSVPSIVKVDGKGKVTAQKAGTATISVMVNRQKLKCTVTVKSTSYKNILGKWAGTYDGFVYGSLIERKIELEIFNCDSWGVIDGFATIDEERNGKYYFSGKVNFNTGEVSFIGEKWIYNPEGLTFTYFHGILKNNNIVGNLEDYSDRKFKISKISDKFTSYIVKPDKVIGNWEGEYDGYFNTIVVRRNLKINIENVDQDGRISGTAIISPSLKSDSSVGINASYKFKGTIDLKRGIIYIHGCDWIKYPDLEGNFSFSILNGLVDYQKGIIKGWSEKGIWKMTKIK